MRATGWPDNFADTWELQMLPRASSLLNVSVEAVRRLAARFFSASFHFRPSLRIFFFPSFSFSPPSRVLLSTLSFFFFFFSHPSRRHRETLKLATVDEQCVSVKLEGRTLFFSIYFFRRKSEFSLVFSTDVLIYGYWYHIDVKLKLETNERICFVILKISQYFVRSIAICLNHIFSISSLIIEIKLKRFCFEWFQEKRFHVLSWPRVILSSFPTNFHKIDMDGTNDTEPDLSWTKIDLLNVIIIDLVKRPGFTIPTIIAFVMR